MRLGLTKGKVSLEDIFYFGRFDMAAKGRKETNEQEFQSRVVNWLDAEIKRCHKPLLDQATSEKPDQHSGRRNDVVVWQDRRTTNGFLTMELKTPETPISDPVFYADALAKAQKWNAPVFCIWNMQRAELYLTPDADQPPPVTPFCSFDSVIPVKKVQDWLQPAVAKALEDIAKKLLDAAIFELARKGKIAVVFESDIFVARLEDIIRRLRVVLHGELQAQIKSSKKVRAKINSMAAAQGFAGFVEDIELAMSGQLAYRFAGQILFYYALRRKNTSLPELTPNRKAALSPQLRHHWDLVRRFDYEALYGLDELEKLVPLSNSAEDLLHGLIDMLAHYDWAALTDDVLGSIFERLIPREEQILLGQFYTPKPVTDLLVALVIDGVSPLVLDPGCGSGTFLMSAYEYHAKVQGNPHTEILSKIWGFDLSPFATELASINLYRQNLSSFDNFPRIVPGSFFDRSVGETIEFPPPKPPQTGVKRLKVPIPEFDAIVANPPYLRSQNQDDLDPNYRSVLFASAARMGIVAPPKTDLFAFFLFHSFEFLKPGGKLGFVIPASWLSADYGVEIQRFLLTKMQLVSIVTSEAESFFSQVDVNTVLLIAEKPEAPSTDAIAKFITIKQSLANIFPAGSDYWDKVLDFAASTENVEKDVETDEYRIKTVPLSNQSGVTCLEAGNNWSRYLRAPLSYFNLFKDDGLTVALEELADVGLGFKSLQNDFFYVTGETVSTYGIEGRFLNPISTLKEFDPSKYQQAPIAEKMVFTCADAESNIKGTGALKYIRTMGRRAASKRKQSGKTETMAEVLGKQGGRYWYAPKASQNAARIWLRKGVGGVFSPFICDIPLVVDQRCNFALPKNITDNELAALLTSSVVSFSIEINGSFSMGGGVLEVPTTKLRTYPVPDIRQWSNADRKQLVSLAKKAWMSSKPIDWSSDDVPDKKLVALDEFVLQHIDGGISTDALYKDLKSAVQVRYRLAKDKSGKQTKRQSESITSVATSVASKVSPVLETKLFPEGFVSSKASMEHFDLLGKSWRVIKLHPMMGQTELWFEAEDGEQTQETFPCSVAEIIVRSILLGRSNFDYPNDENESKSILDDMHDWLATLQGILDESIAASAAGSGYEDTVMNASLSMLRIHPIVFEKTLPARIEL